MDFELLSHDPELCTQFRWQFKALTLTVSAWTLIKCHFGVIIIILILIITHLSLFNSCWTIALCNLVYCCQNKENKLNWCIDNITIYYKIIYDLLFCFQVAVCTMCVTLLLVLGHSLQCTEQKPFFFFIPQSMGHHKKKSFSSILFWSSCLLLPTGQNMLWEG